MALVDSGHVSEVTAGENTGRRLVHDHVVRALRRAIAVSDNGDATGDVTLPLPAEWGRAMTIIAFVQNTETGDVLQVVSLPVATDTCAVRH